MSVSFSRDELRDLLVAWLALGIAFALFLDRSLAFGALVGELVPFLGAFALSLVTVGIGFLLHELAHKVVATRYGQVAHFRADYGMLGLAIASGLAGFLFAAPGAVVHRGRITERENGVIALAGPAANLALASIFFPLSLLGGAVGGVGDLGVTINVLLAAFNMLPFGPLDGRTVLAWSKAVFAVAFVPSVLLALWAFLL